MSSPPLAIQVVLILLAVTAAIIDAVKRRIPNWLTLPGVVLGIALNSFLFGTTGLWSSLEGLGLAMLIYFPLFAVRGMGAGDVKLMAAVGALVGPANWFGILVVTSIFGAAAALISIVARGRFRRTFQNIWLILVSLRMRRAPYADNPELDVGSERAVRLPHGIVVGCGVVGFLVTAAAWAPH